MIHLEHINLVVNSLSESLTFYQAAFPHWFIRDEGKDTWHDVPRHWLHFGDDYQYIAMSDFYEFENSDKNRDLSGHHLGLAHFAFVTQNLNAVIDRLKQAGFSIDKMGGKNSFRKNIYFIDPSGFEVEFVEYLTDLPQERNSTIE